jgi:rhodanese-related sulfurtransferase|tara:strand:- start:103 stop:507 length:405 start_codon:yes stop_codon:yes gene_type:complete
MLNITKSFKKLVAEAEAQVKSLTPAEVEKKLKQNGVTLIDLRDIRELKRDGTIADSIHIPRGMLEFWVDPESPYYKSELNDTEEVILFCNGGWRSALAAASLQSMGVKNVAHMSGGFGQWQKEIGRVVQISASK